jgi:hypothetical protein
MNLDGEDEVDEIETPEEPTKQEQGEENSLLVDRVWNEFWKYAQTYRIGDEQYWYIMDEVGSAISHDDEPNFKCM